MSVTAILIYMKKREVPNISDVNIKMISINKWAFALKEGIRAIIHFQYLCRA